MKSVYKGTNIHLYIQRQQNHVKNYTECRHVKADQQRGAHERK